MKEFNKNGKIIIFENEKDDKNHYLIIVKKNNQFYACDRLIKDFFKYNSKTKCFKKDGNVNLDLKNFKMHYIVPLNYGDYWRKLLNIAENRRLTQEEFQHAIKVHNALPKEVRTKNLDAFVYKKYHLTPEEHMREQAIHLMLKDGIVVYYHHYYADLNKLFRENILPIVKVPAEIIEQNLQKEFFDLQLESAEDRLKEKDKIEPKNVYDFRNIVYKTTEFDYSIYLEGPEMDYQKFNENGNYLIFPLYYIENTYDDNGYIEDAEHIDIFKYKNEIYVIPNNIESDYYYIDLKNMYYFVSLENTKAKEKFESIPIEYRCKISIQDDNKIKFYDENCEKRIKEMLKMVSANKVHEEKNINDIENKVYKTIEDKYGYYLDGGTLNLKEFNKNGIFLIFEMSLDYDRTMNKYLKIFKYKNDIFINRMNVKDNIFYIDMTEMYFLPDIEQDQVANDIANRGKTCMFCKVSIQDDNKIKFYNKTCEKRIKEMLKMDFQK